MLQSLLCSMKIKVGIIESNPVSKEALFAIIQQMPEFICTIISGSVEEFILAVNSKKYPAILMMDIGLAGQNGIAYIHKILPDAEILLVNGDETTDDVFKILCKGATGVIPRDSSTEKLKEALLTIASGGSVISPFITRNIIQQLRVINNALPSKKQIN